MVGVYGDYQGDAQDLASQDPSPLNQYYSSAAGTDLTWAGDLKTNRNGYHDSVTGKLDRRVALHDREG